MDCIGRGFPEGENRLEGTPAISAKEGQHSVHGWYPHANKGMAVCMHLCGMAAPRWNNERLVLLEESCRPSAAGNGARKHDFAPTAFHWKKNREGCHKKEKTIFMWLRKTRGDQFVTKQATSRVTWGLLFGRTCEQQLRPLTGKDCGE